MNPVAAIGLLAVAFVGTHLLMSSDFVRPRLVERIGEQPFRGLYSLLAFATLIPLVAVFGHNKHAGAMLWYLRDMQPIRWLTWLMMLAALILLVAGLFNPNPATIGAPSQRRVRGILKLSCHPSFVAFALFGFAHMLMNGWVGDLLFFGTFPALGVLGGFHQDRRKLREMGETYRRFAAETSFFPGLALLDSRQRWSSADVPWTALGIGAAVTILIVIVHPMIFGGSSLG